MKNNDFEILKQCTDYCEYHLIGGKYYKVGSYGLSKHKGDRHFTQIGHCNDFRNMSFADVVRQLNSPL